MNKSVFFQPAGVRLPHHLRWGILCLSLSLFYSIAGHAQCNPDVTPPTVPCAQFYLTYMDLNGPNLTILPAADLDEGSTDNCTAPGNLRFRISETASATPPTTTEIAITAAGVYEYHFWVLDEAGNWSSCLKPVWVDVPSCSPDVTPPIINTPPDMTITSEALEAFNIDFTDPDQALINAAFGTATHWDNCSHENSSYAESYYLLQYPDFSFRRIQRRFFVTDAANNLEDNGVQYIDIYPTYSAHVPAFYFPGNTLTDSLTFTGNELGKKRTDQYFNAACDGSLAKIERLWELTDSNLLILQPQTRVLPQLDRNNDGIFGDAYDVIAIADSLWLYENGAPIQPLVKRSAHYSYLQILRYNYLDTAAYLVTGSVFLDTMANCVRETDEPGMGGWKVKAIGSPSQRVYQTVTQANGSYGLFICNDDVSIEISLGAPYNYAGACDAVYTRTLGPGQFLTQHFPVQLNQSCQLLDVDIATPVLRPCFNGHYTVHYCNYHDAEIPATYVDVALDSLIQYTGSSIPGTLLGGNTYRFQTGDLAAGDCSDFQIDFLLNCDAPVGMTHCVEAHIFPEDPCGWSGPVLKAAATCAGDSVQLTITNIGTLGMDTPLDFVVAEDLIMLMVEPVQLGVSDVMKLKVPATGATWRIEVPQAPGYPWGGAAIAVQEGCGGINQLGLVNQLPVNPPNPFIAVNCMESTSSFDPNDKQALPKGVDNQFFINQNTDIEYMIRFQNTGTDTAFTVVVLDTLPVWLDAGSVRPGAASHQYDFDVIDNSVLRFRFDQILLPDSNKNEAASHGFVKFRVKQQPNNPLGTIIANTAAIYFDFNAPVITNNAWHTVGADFLLVKTTDPLSAAKPLVIFPNPASDYMYMTIPESRQNTQVLLTDQSGKTVVSRSFNGQTIRLERGNLPPGMYFFRVTTEQGALYEGKLLFR